MASKFILFYLGFGSVGRSCPRESAQKTEEKQENVGKAETKTEVKKEVIIPVTVEKEVPTKVPEVNPYAQVADAIAAARAAELANAQSFADFANQAAAVVEVKVAPIEAMLAAQAAEARAAAAQAAEAKAVAQAAAEAAARAAAQAAAEAAAQAAEEARKQTPSPQPTTTPQQSPSRDSGDWTIVDDVEKSNASAAAAANLGARPKSPPQQPLVEKAPLHPGNLTRCFFIDLFSTLRVLNMQIRLLLLLWRQCSPWDSQTKEAGFLNSWKLKAATLEKLSMSCSHDSNVNNIRKRRGNDSFVSLSDFFLFFLNLNRLYSSLLVQRTI